MWHRAEHGNPSVSDSSGKNGLGWLFVNKKHEQSNDLLSIFPTSDCQR